MEEQNVSLEILALTDAQEFMKQFLSRVKLPDWVGDEDLHMTCEEAVYQIFDGVSIAEVRVDVNRDEDDERTSGPISLVCKIVKHVEGKEPKVLNYVRVGGVYSSYEGEEWDDQWLFVKPIQVTVTRFVPI